LPHVDGAAEDDGIVATEVAHHVDIDDLGRKTVLIEHASDRLGDLESCTVFAGCGDENCYLLLLSVLCGRVRQVGRARLRCRSDARPAATRAAEIAIRLRTGRAVS
jgi:hypothetical protein